MAGAAGLLIVLLVSGAGPARGADDQEAWLGVQTQTLTPELREGLGYDGAGALVNRVVDGSPADRAGVRKGDVIVGLNGATVASATDLARAVTAARVGQTVSLRIVREGAHRSLSAKLAARPEEGGDSEMRDAPETPEAPEAPEPPQPPSVKNDDGDFDFSFRGAGPGMAWLGMGRGRLGVRVESLNPDLGSYFGARDGKGVLILEVLKDTPAERAGLKAGDVVTRVGERSIASSEELVNALSSAERRVTLTIVRKGQTRTIESELNEGSRAMRIPRDGALGLRDGDVRILRGGDADLRRQLDDLRRELRELKQRVQELNRN